MFIFRLKNFENGAMYAKNALAKIDLACEVCCYLVCFAIDLLLVKILLKEGGSCLQLTS